MPKVAQITETININPSLLAFKPRQVVLLCKPPAPTMKMKQNDGTNNNNIKTLILNPEQKDLLFHSIAKYLESSGFSKTLKKFRSEAKIQNDDLENSSFDLEEMFCKFLDMCNHVSKNFKSQKVQELQTDGISRKDGEGEGKKKKSDKSTGDKSIDSKNDGETMTDDAGPIGEKSKEKKRNKKNSNSLDQEEQVSTKVLQEPVEERKKVTDSRIDNKPKDKKKKKNKLSSNPVVDEGKPNKSDSKTPKEDVTDKESKSSKKRKRMASEEDVVQAAGENLVEESKPRKTEESKRRKTEGSKEPKIQEQSAELNSANITEEKAWKEESSHVGSIESQKKSVKQINGHSNGSLKEDGEKSAMRKTIKQQNGSAEPKTVKHFQRVKVDDVFLSDEKLNDNSYWAKDGAEIGYGAKAQEVLGQVRGRDFRHEKTKKKRGTYRGGQIDVHSHSVKFNYSDDD